MGERLNLVRFGPGLGVELYHQLVQHGLKFLKGRRVAAGRGETPSQQTMPEGISAGFGLAFGSDGAVAVLAIRAAGGDLGRGTGRLCAGEGDEGSGGAGDLGSRILMVFFLDK